MERIVRVTAVTDAGRYVARLETRLSDNAIYTKELSNFSDHTSKERTALYAAVQTMSALRKPCTVVYQADTPYLAAAYKRLNEWKQNGWMTVKKQQVKNQDLWEALEAACAKTGSTIRFHYNKEEIKQEEPNE